LLSRGWRAGVNIPASGDGGHCALAMVEDTDLPHISVSTDRKRRVLFVDDEKSVLTLLQAVCRRIGPDWEVAFADNGPRALELMKDSAFDVVVSDMRMPEMNGVELLDEVMKLHPQTARVILSGYADQQLILRSLGATHQYLTKPCDMALLRSTIQRILSLNEFLSSDHLKVVVSRINRLPSLPSLYFRLMQELGSVDATTDSVGNLISEDVSLTAKLLQLVNSAFFGVAHPVTSAKDAVQILGFSTVKTLALSIYVFSRFDPAQLPGFPIERIWRHSMATGLLARRIAAAEGGDLAVIESAFTAGILHDIGKVILGYSLPELHQRAVELAAQRKIPQYQAEAEVVGANHAEMGGYLLGLWGLPASIVESVAWHHQPQAREPLEFSPLTAVHMANYIQGRFAPASDPPLPPSLDRSYIQAIKLATPLRTWEENAAQQEY